MGDVPDGRRGQLHRWGAQVIAVGLRVAAYALAAAGRPASADGAADSPDVAAGSGVPAATVGTSVGTEFSRYRSTPANLMCRTSPGADHFTRTSSCSRLMSTRPDGDARYAALRVKCVDGGCNALCCMARTGTAAAGSSRTTRRRW